jgi:transcriptional regulator with PAS, ATPase and Fis domain
MLYLNIDCDREAFAPRTMSPCGRGNILIVNQHKPLTRDEVNFTFLSYILDNPFEGILAIDDKGIIVYVNNFFLSMFKSKEGDFLGKKVWDTLPDFPLYDTVLQGYSHWGENLKIGGRNLLTVRFPIKKDGKVIGAVVKTIFPDLTTAKGIAARVMNPVKVEERGRPMYTCMDIIGETSPMLVAMKIARKAARTDSTLLITGESGTGKEVFAQAVHTRSVRRDRPFVKVNCAAIPDNLLESELFGFVDGAFTGATKGGKPGKFELAEGGTIFLDEIGDMSLPMQAKLLRVLQEKEVDRIGSTKSIPLDVRISAATNQDLLKLVREGRFREDLYYRLKVVEIRIPPLRERREDIPVLADYLRKRINKRLGTHVQVIKPESLRLMLSYDWPGNVRELENILEQAINQSEDNRIDLTDLIAPKDGMYQEVRVLKDRQEGLRKFVDLKEKTLILDALAQSGGNKAEAARILNIQRSVLYKKMARLKI